MKVWQDIINVSNKIELLDYHLVSNILCGTTSPFKYNVKKNKKISGLEFFSYIIPQGINAIKKDFQIKDGNLLKGVLDKNSLSTKKNSIIHYIWDKFGPDKTSNFIDLPMFLKQSFIQLLELLAQEWRWICNARQ